MRRPWRAASTNVFSPSPTFGGAFSASARSTSATVSSAA